MPSAWYSRQPEQRAREQEVADLVAPEVEDERAPVGVRAAARVGVLVQRRAVEAGERPVVAREVRRDPVEDHADAALVQAVDELAEVVGRAEARRRGEVRGHLVAPRAAERVRHDRQQLDVREAQVGHVVGQLVGELEVGQRAVALQRVAPPGAEVDLVDRHRLRAAAARRARARIHSSSATRSAGGARPRPSAAAARLRTRTGRPSAAARRPGRGSRTCSASPRPTSGTNSSQMPLEPSERIGCRRPSQELKSPTTLTERADGAQTANATPVTPSISCTCAPSFS